MKIKKCFDHIRQCHRYRHLLLLQSKSSFYQNTEKTPVGIFNEVLKKRVERWISLKVSAYEFVILNYYTTMVVKYKTPPFIIS
ncbi:MAG TPA: hypothetical protein VGC75_07375 [Candidatus Nitrosocosmicus sp.]